MREGCPPPGQVRAARGWGACGCWKGRVWSQWSQELPALPRLPPLHLAQGLRLLGLVCFHLFPGSPRSGSIVRREGAEERAAWVSSSLCGGRTRLLTLRGGRETRPWGGHPGPQPAVSSPTPLAGSLSSAAPEAWDPQYGTFQKSLF